MSAFLQTNFYQGESTLPLQSKGTTRKAKGKVHVVPASRSSFHGKTPERGARAKALALRPYGRPTSRTYRSPTLLGNRRRVRCATHYRCDFRHHRWSYLSLPRWSLCDDQRTGCGSCASTSGRHDCARPWRLGCGISALTGGDLSDRGGAGGVESLSCREIGLVLSHLRSRRHVKRDRYAHYHQTNSATPGRPVAAGQIHSRCDSGDSSRYP